MGVLNSGIGEATAEIHGLTLVNGLVGSGVNSRRNIPTVAFAVSDPLAPSLSVTVSVTV